MFSSRNEIVFVPLPRARCGRSGWTLLTKILCLSVLVPPAVSFAASDAPKSSLARSKPAYNRDIRPILSDNCFYCHGPDTNKREGKLRRDVRAEALAKQAIVPGKPDESELIRRISAKDPDDLMPPSESH